ncbi:MAG: ABC transporter permease DevC [Cyanophyceae cyanobacterium]
MILRTLSIAWAQLLYQKVQTIITILGIAFTAILLFMQLGFRVGLLESSTQLPASFQSDIVMTSRLSPAFTVAAPFSRRRLNQVLAFDEVESVTPIYKTATRVKRRVDQPSFMANIQVIAFPPNEKVIDLPGVRENQDQLKNAGFFLLDQRSRPELTTLIETVRREGEAETEITTSGFQRKKIDLVGLFEMGANPFSNGALITSESEFFNSFNLNRGEVFAGLIHVKPGSNISDLIRRLRLYLPDDVKVSSKSELIQEDKEYIERSSPMGIVILFSLTFSMIIGVVILYQVLYQNISRFIKEYATLKAIGYGQDFLAAIVLEQVVIFAITGYIPGFITSIFIYDALSETTKMTFDLTAGIAILVFVLTLMICVVSGLIATNKLREANPVDVF